MLASCELHIWHKTKGWVLCGKEAAYQGEKEDPDGIMQKKCFCKKHLDDALFTSWKIVAKVGNY